MNTEQIALLIFGAVVVIEIILDFTKDVLNNK